MGKMNSLKRETAVEPASPVNVARSAGRDDNAMLRAAANLTRDLNVPSAAIYWSDMLGSALLGYAALFMALSAGSTAIGVAAGLVAVLALYRAGSFIHELTHIKQGALPGFKLVWNLVVGVPLLVPSFMYEGVHNQHHAKTYYGTANDPEYLPLALMKPWTLPVFLLAAALAPIGLLIRFAILAPLSLVSSKLRDMVVAKYSGLQINPSFRQPPPASGPLRSLPWWPWASFPCGTSRSFSALPRGSCSSIRYGPWLPICGKMRERR
jgi:fatty acid desaturase